MPLLEAPADVRPAPPVGPLIPPLHDRSCPIRTHGGQRRSDWEQLLAYRTAIVGFLRGRCRDIHQAEDIAHDTMVRAAQSLGLGRERSVMNVRSWLVQIAANLHRDAHRRDAFESLVPDDSVVFASREGREPVPGDQDPGAMFSVAGRAINSADLVEGLNPLMAQLPPRDRTLLTSYYIEGGTLADTARRVGCEPRLAKVWMYRARRRLGRRLRQRHGALCSGIRLRGADS